MCLPIPIESPDYRKPLVSFGPDGIASFTCETIGVSGTTSIFIRRTPSSLKDYEYKYEARMGVAILGQANDPDCHKKSPFDEDWWDNHVGGIGYTLEVALRKLKESILGLQDSLWAEI